MPPKSRLSPDFPTGRPGTIRAIVGCVALLLVGVAGLTAVRMSASDDVADTRQTEITRHAMGNLVAPPAPGTFALSADAPDLAEEPLVLVSSTDSTAPDCVARLDQFLTASPVHFSASSADIAPDNIPLLSQISDAIMRCSDAYVMIAGHADGSDDDAVNLALSWDRADRMVHNLVMLGVDPAAIEAVGFGARAPLAQGSDADDGADRRVDFRVLRRP